MHACFVCPAFLAWGRRPVIRGAIGKDSSFLPFPFSFAFSFLSLASLLGWNPVRVRGTTDRLVFSSAPLTAVGAMIGAWGAVWYAPVYISDP